MDDEELSRAFSAISFVIQNRPRPIAETDLFYMRLGDMLAQAGVVGRWAADASLCIIGDADFLGVSIAYLGHERVIPNAPGRILVLDYDERIVSAVQRFADREGIADRLDAALYNVIDPLPPLDRFDFFYVNPPWGQHNRGESVKVFMERGFEAVRYGGDGLVVMADEDDLPWTQAVIETSQRFALEAGYYISRFEPHQHRYHQGRGVEPISSNLYLRARDGNGRRGESKAMPAERLAHFYGLGLDPKIQYILENKDPNYGKASSGEYRIAWRNETA